MNVLNRFWMSSVALVALSVMGGAAAVAQTPSPSPQILGGASTDSETAQIPNPPDMPPPPTSAGVVDVPSATPTPDTAALAKPSDAPAVPAPPDVSTTMTPMPGTVSTPPAPSPDMMQVVSGDSTTKKVVADKTAPEKPDAYYDSQVNVPSGPLANSVGPRKVDPTLEPGSKFVVAKKNASAANPESLLIAAGRALDLDRNDAALEMFDELYKKNPRDPRILMGRAVAQQKMGQEDLAIVSYQALLDIDPGNPDALVNMMGLLQKQYPAVALRRLTDLQDKRPGNPGIAAQLGMTYAQMGNHQAALTELGRAASLDPNNAQHTFNMAIIYDRAGDRSNAIRYYEQSLQTDAIYGASRSIPREKVYDRLAKLRQ